MTDLVRMGRLAILGMLVATFVTACIPTGGGCEDLPDRVEVTVTADGMEPTQASVCRDRDVTLILQPEIDGVFHIHGYDEQVPATTITSGETLALSFTTGRSGQFPVEFHTDDEPQGIDVGILTVREP